MKTRDLLEKLGLTDEQIRELRRRLAAKQRPKPADKMRRKPEDK